MGKDRQAVVGPLHYSGSTSGPTAQHWLFHTVPPFRVLDLRHGVRGQAPVVIELQAFPEFILGPLALGRGPWRSSSPENTTQINSKVTQLGFQERFP